MNTNHLQETNTKPLITNSTAATQITIRELNKIKLENKIRECEYPRNPKANTELRNN